MWKIRLAGAVRFKVADADVALLNKLRKFGVFDVESIDRDIHFSTSLVKKSSVERILGKKTYTTTQNINLFSVLNFFYNRLSFVACAFVCIVAFLMLNQFAFRVRVDGLTGDERAAVTAHLGTLGVRGLTPKRIAHDNALAMNIIENFPFAAACSVELHGATLVVVVHRAEVIVPNSGDVLATADGVITEIVVFSGTANVSVGDVVRTGDVLVTGLRPTAIITISNGPETVAIINNTKQAKDFVPPIAKPKKS